MAKRKSTGASAPTYKKYKKIYNRDVKAFNHARKNYDSAKVNEKQRPTVKNKRHVKVMRKKFSRARNNLNRASNNLNNYHVRKRQATHKKMFSKIKQSHKYWNSSYGYLASNDAYNDNDFVFFKLNTEEPQYSNSLDSSSTPEKGSSINTNSERQLVSVNVSGYIGGDIGYHWRTVKGIESRIIRWFNNEESLYFQGQRIHRDVEITSFNPQHTTDANSGAVNALGFSMTITVANYAESNLTVKKHSVHDKGKIDKTMGVAKHKHGHTRAKKNDTYTSIARRMKVPLSELMSKNKTNQYDIQVGQKIYY